MLTGEPLLNGTALRLFALQASRDFGGRVSVALTVNGPPMPGSGTGPEPGTDRPITAKEPDGT